MLFALLGGLLYWLLAVQPGWGWESTYFDLFENSVSARAAALGGLHAALADDGTVLFSNPAGLQAVEPQLSVLQAGLSLYDSASEFVAELFSDMVGSGDGRNGTFSLWGPLAISYVGKGKGFGLFSSSNVYIYRWDSTPDAREALEQNLVLIGARAFRIPLSGRSASYLDIGFSLVGFITAWGMSTTGLQEVFAGTASFSDLLTSGGQYKRSLGASVEMGILYSSGEAFSIGLSGRNLAIVQTREFTDFSGFFGGGTADSSFGVLPMDISIGVVFRPPLGRLERVFSHLLLAADYRNIFDFLFYPDGSTSPLLHAAIGMEVKLLEIVSLRAGFYQCLPSFGAGLDLSLFSLNLAFYGRELSAQPWGQPITSFTAEVVTRY